MKALIRLNVNGRDHELHVPLHKTLLEVLREDLGLTGTKHGCELGECGACTVLVDGQPQLSCLALPVQLQGTRIETIESMGTPVNPHPLQAAFAEKGAAQCGYCTPGMLMSAKALYEKQADADREQIKEALSGNLCRCTGYIQIIDAVADALAQKQAAATKPDPAPVGGGEE